MMKKKWLLFVVLLSITILDRYITLINFGFVYSDIDQVVLWNGALDYSKGIFHEPFFYGQAYNYMLESFLAVPLIWLNVPGYMALPIVTSLVSLLPFIVLAILFMKQENYFWSYLCLVFPVLLPEEYNFLTTIPRGFVQSHFFVPLLFVPLFNPQIKRNVTILYIASALCFISNQSSVFIILPVLLWVFLHHDRSASFYWKALLVIPFLLIDQLAKYFYKIHPERVLHSISGLRIDGKTFISSLKNIHHFEFLFPFFSNGGLLYMVVFTLLAIIARSKRMKKEFLFVVSILFLLIITLAAPKIQQDYPDGGGLFFSASRFYLYLPVLLIISSYLIFRQFKFNKISLYLLLVFCGLAFSIKNYGITESVNKTIKETAFPVAMNQDLIKRADELKQLSVKYHLDLIVHANAEGWNYVFDSYAYHPLTHAASDNGKEAVSVNLNGDRRTWLYANSIHCRQILLNGFAIEDSRLNGLDYELINERQIVIKNNSLNTTELFERLSLQFGNR